MTSGGRQMVERLDPKRVLNCIENDLSEGPRAPRGRHRKRQGEENSTPPAEPANKSFFKSNKLEDLKPLKLIVNKEPINFNLPSRNKKLCDDIPFVDVSFTVNDGFLAKNGLQRLKTVKRLIAEGKNVLTTEIGDRKLLSDYPYVFVGQRTPSARPSPVKKKVSFSNMDIEINEYTVAKRRKTGTPVVESKSALKKTSYPPPEYTAFHTKPPTPDSSRLSRCRIEKLTWRSETKTTSPTSATDRPKIKLKLTSRKIMVDVSPDRRGSVSSTSSVESETRRNGKIADVTPKKQTRSKTRSEEVISIESSDDEQRRENDMAPPPPPPPRTPVRTKAALKMTVDLTQPDKEKTPEASSSDESATKGEPVRRRFGRPPKRRRGRKTKEEDPKVKAARERQLKKKKKSMPFKVRFTKNLDCSECDMCSSVFTKNVELQLHLLNHLQKQNFVVKVPLIPERVIDKFVVAEPAEPVLQPEPAVSAEDSDKAVPEDLPEPEKAEDAVSDTRMECDTAEEPVTTSDAAIGTVEDAASEPTSSEAEATCSEVEGKPEVAGITESAKDSSLEETSDGNVEEVSSSDQVTEASLKEEVLPPNDEPLSCEVNSSSSEKPIEQVDEVQASGDVVDESCQAVENVTSCNGVESTEEADVPEQCDVPEQSDVPVEQKDAVVADEGAKEDAASSKRKRSVSDDDELPKAKRDCKYDDAVPGTSSAE